MREFRASTPVGGAPRQSRLKLPHLRLIAAIEETGMISAAAQALNMSQPAASRMIGEMETLLEAQLCERLSRGVRLTRLASERRALAAPSCYPAGPSCAPNASRIVRT